MLLYLVYPTVNTVPPIAPDFRKSPRLHVLDTGLMNHFAGIQKELTTTNDLQAVYQGKMIEHLVGQELLSGHYNVLHQLAFWVRQKKEAIAELDYVILVDGYIIPIEVKSGSAGTLRSLHSFMEQAPHHWALRLYSGTLNLNEVKTPEGKKFQLLSLPYYLAGQSEAYIRWLMDRTKN